uniref:Homeobox domain-containing protein n=1 Tax=Steinernema glaseri TaxID=37863 RepID=A0A1I7ZEJ2_9BILA
MTQQLAQMASTQPDGFLALCEKVVAAAKQLPLSHQPRAMAIFTTPYFIPTLTLPTLNFPMPSVGPSSPPNLLNLAFPGLLPAFTPPTNLLPPLFPTPPSNESTGNKRPAPTSAANADTPQLPRKAKRTRTLYTPAQTAILLANYRKNNQLTRITRQKIAEETKLDVAQVNKWFQNRRNKQRKQKGSTSEESIGSAEEDGAMEESQDLDHIDQEKDEFSGDDDRKDEPPDQIAT